MRVVLKVQRFRKDRTHVVQHADGKSELYIKKIQKKTKRRKGREDPSTNSVSKSKNAYEAEGTRQSNQLSDRAGKMIRLAHSSDIITYVPRAKIARSRCKNGCGMN